MLYILVLFSIVLYFYCIKIVGLRSYSVFFPSVSLSWGVLFFLLLGVPIDYFFYDGRYIYNYDFFLSHVLFFFISSSLALFILRVSNFSKGGSVSFGIDNFLKCYRFFVFLGGFGFLILYSRMPEIPLLSNDVHYARINSLKGLGYNYKLSIFLLYVGFAGLCICFIRKGMFKRCVIWCAALVFLTIFTANRIDSLFFILILLVSWLLVSSGGGNISRKKIIFFGVFITFVLFFSAALQYARHHGLEALIKNDVNDILLFSWGGFLHRFWVQLENLSLVLSGRLDLPWYTTFLNDFMMAVPGAGVSQTSGVLIKNELRLIFKGGGITPSFIGEGYIGFGFLGSYIYTSLLAFFFVFISAFISRRVLVDSPYFPALLVGSLFFHGVATTTIGAVFVHSIIPVFIICFFIYLYGCMRRKF